MACQQLTRISESALRASVFRVFSFIESKLRDNESLFSQNTKKLRLKIGRCIYSCFFLYQILHIFDIFSENVFLKDILTRVSIVYNTISIDDIKCLPWKSLLLSITVHNWKFWWIFLGSFIDKSR